MRSFIILSISLLFFCMNLMLSHFIAKDLKRDFSESYLLLNKAALIAVPRDIHFGTSDMNFVNTLSFIGYSLDVGRGHINRKVALKVYTSLDAITTYNPRYFDPYYVANAFLTWDVGLYEEAITLLKRGMVHIDDWRIPFYIGFIYFYFLNDNLNGAEYLKIAARHPSAREYNLLPLLASRLYYEEGKYELAIILLREQLRIMKDENMKKAVASRLKTLQTAYEISKAIDQFRLKFGRNPKSIEELETAGLIPKGLKDSAGGKFYITPDGKVRSESELFPIKKKLLEERRRM
ncbi:hypothetical protein BCF55_1278 [Hydrogenivirga caldilitoris]|uniref:Tetratricopeptide repeat protein n=1 Tax=Hydrogenivirga caldilitoris TaxID=246264 RepID=A0A497XSA6_9AQUI|nr:hypothetical protein [Hydrogenivirga caldilitoris]RLJ70989.1 hypothetical protein BCF55_1278 [Hydrogenivirga caldilitoris]